MHLFVIICQADEGRLLGVHRAFLFAALLHIGEGQCLRILDIIATILVSLGGPVSFFGGLSMQVRGLVGDGDVVVVGFMLKLDSAGEVLVMMGPRLATAFKIVLLVLLVLVFQVFFLVDEGRLIIFSLDGAQFGLLVTHII